MIYFYGFDTSKWQASKVDYYKAKLEGMDFVFLRIGCNKTKDKCFEQDYKSAISAGLKVGVYFYTHAVSTVDALADATRVLGWLNNRHLDFPIAYDVEDEKQKKLSKVLNSHLYLTFKKKIEDGGVYDAILYTGDYFYKTYFQTNLIDDDLWIAKYSVTRPNTNVAIWQYSSSEINTSYYQGKLDRNYMFVTNFRGSNEQILNTSFNPYPEPERIIKLKLPRIKGNDVKWIQWALGMNDAEIDGIYGPVTKARVLEWQKKNGLLCDGIVGSATIYSLKYD